MANPVLMPKRLRLLAALATAAAVATVLPISGCSDGSDNARPPSSLPSARVGTSIELGGNPVAVVVGAGAVWVVDASRRTLTKVDPRTRAVVGRPRRVAGGPFAVAVGEGAVWVAAGDGAVRAYDPHTVRPTGSTVRVPGANGLAVGGGGVWISSRRAGTVTRVDPRTRRADAPIRVGPGPADIVVGYGSVWVANAAGGSVSRIDPRRGTAGAPIAVGARQVLAVSIGEGGVWVARAGGSNGDRTQLVPIDPAKDQVVGDPITVAGAVPLDLVAGHGLWVTDSGSAIPSASSRGGVTRVNPETRAIDGPPLRTGRRPSAIALGAGRLWVASERSGTLTPITIGPAR